MPDIDDDEQPKDFDAIQRAASDQLGVGVEQFLSEGLSNASAAKNIADAGALRAKVWATLNENMAKVFDGDSTFTAPPEVSPMELSNPIELEIHVYRHIALVVQHLRCPTKFAARVLRIEITPAVLARLRALAEPSVFTKLQSPPKFMGVDVYTVPGLPLPGWRVINPYVGADWL